MLDELAEFDVEFFSQRGFAVEVDKAFEGIPWRFHKLVSRDEQSFAVECRTSGSPLPPAFRLVTRMMSQLQPNVQVCIEVERDIVTEEYFNMAGRLGTPLFLIDGESIAPIWDPAGESFEDLDRLIAGSIEAFAQVPSRPARAPFDSDAFFTDVHPRIMRLSERYASYSLERIDQYAIRHWLDQFDGEDKAVALKLLEEVMWFDQTSVNSGCRQIYNEVKNRYGDSLGTTYFASIGSAGHSGTDMLRIFRSANRLTARRHNGQFTLSAKAGELAPGARVVLVDDFLGSGRTALRELQRWRELTVGKELEVCFAAIAAFVDAVEKIEAEDCETVVCHYLDDTHRLFSPRNAAFSGDEKRRLEYYCRARTYSSEPLGYGGTQSYVVFHTRAPNNDVSILIARNQHWEGLFPR